MWALQIQRFGSPSEVSKLVEMADTPPGLQIFGLDTVAINVVEGANILSQAEPFFKSEQSSKAHIAERYTLSDAHMSGLAR